MRRGRSRLFARFSRWIGREPIRELTAHKWGSAATRLRLSARAFKILNSDSLPPLTRQTFTEQSANVAHVDALRRSSVTAQGSNPIPAPVPNVAQRSKENVQPPPVEKPKVARPEPEAVRTTRFVEDMVRTREPVIATTDHFLPRKESMQQHGIDRAALLTKPMQKSLRDLFIEQARYSEVIEDVLLKSISKPEELDVEDVLERHRKQLAAEAYDAALKWQANGHWARLLIRIRSRKEGKAAPSFWTLATVVGIHKDEWDAVKLTPTNTSAEATRAKFMPPPTQGMGF